MIVSNEQSATIDFLGAEITKSKRSEINWKVVKIFFLKVVETDVGAITTR